MTTDTINAAIYTRVSTEEQAQKEKVSLDVQKEKAGAYCQAQGWEIAETYEDAGVSGAKSDRPALTLLLADAREGKFQRVIFWKLDRLGRNLRDLLNISHQLEGYGVGIVSVQDGFDTGTSSGRLYFNILGAMAEFEKDLISERTAMGKLGRARKGLYNTGWTAFGFDYDPETQHLVINKKEAAAVRRIFGMYARDGLSHRRIAERLNEEGVPTKTLQTRSSDGVKKGWWKGQIARILINPIYRGEAYFGKTGMEGNGGTRRKRPQPREAWVPIECPEIVTSEDWEAVQARAKRNKRDSQRPKDRVSTFILSGLIRCKACGRPMYGYTLRKRRRGKMETWRYYYCSGQHRYGYQCRPLERVNADKLEAPVLQTIIEAFSNPQKVMEACHAYTEQLQEAQNDQDGLLATVRGYLANAGAERDRLISLCSKGIINEADLAKHFKRLDKEVDGWAAEIVRLQEASQQRQQASEIEQTARAIAREFKLDVEAMTIDERKELLRTLVERVWVDSENKLAIECAIPNLLPDTNMVATDHPA